MEVEIIRVEGLEEAGIEESELNEMWSYVGRKSNPRWLWHAIDAVNAAPGGCLRENVDRQSGKVLADVFGRRKDEVFLQLKKLLEPFGIKRYCTDGWGAVRSAFSGRGA